MTELLIDTCTERAQIALCSSGSLIELLKLPSGFEQSRKLLPEIDALLKKHDLLPSQLSALFVTNGPGSYTGIRMGAIVAKIFSYTCSIPLVALSSLMGFIPEEEGPFAALIDAKIGGVYTLFGKKENACISYSENPKLLSLEAFNEQYITPIPLICPNSRRLAPKLKELFPQKTFLFQDKECDPHRLIQLGQEKLTAGDYSSYGSMELLYLRKTQAEIEKESSTQ